jgi:RNA polymerase sigma-70 factor (ECF subfamily)
MNIIPEKVAKSTAEAFAEFYNIYLPKIFRYICYKVSDTHLAEDLTSTVFEKALTNFKSYHSEQAKFSTWLFRIARNTLIDHFRVSGKRKTVPLGEIDNEPKSTDTPEQAFLEKEETQILRQCVSKLSPKEQEIISLKFGAEMNNRQIAGLLGLSDSNVGVILYRAVRKLRADFTGWRDG